MTVTRREIYSTSMVLALASAVVLSLPFSAFTFHPQHVPAEREPSAAFVVLTAEERTAALKSARTAWQQEAPMARGLYTSLPLGELPEEEQGAILADEDLPCGEVQFVPIASRLPAWQPSLKAVAPQRLEPEPEETRVPAFPREEMLKM